MSRVWLFAPAMLFIVACNANKSENLSPGENDPDQNDQASQLTYSTINSSFDISYMLDAVEIVDARKVYDFEDGSTQDLLFPVENEYSQAPKLLEGQLKLLSEPVEFERSSSNDFLSAITFAELVTPQNPLVRLRVEGESSMASGQSANLSYGINSGSFPFFGSFPTSFLNIESSYQYHYNWLPVSDNYDVSLHLESDWDTAFNSAGSDVNIDKVIVESYPLQEADWQALTQTVEVDKYSQCDQDISLLTATADITLLENDSFSIDGTLYDDGNQVIQFNLDESEFNQNQLQLTGVANSTWASHEGNYPARANIKDLSLLTVSLDINNCNLWVIISNDLGEQLNETLWQEEATIDFAEISDLSDIEMSWLEPDKSTKPIVADYEQGKALLLTPNSIEQNSFYPEDYENRNVAAITLDDFDPRTQLIEVEAEFFGYPGENDGCERSHFSLYLESSDEIEGINVGFRNNVIYQDKQRLFIGSEQDEIRLSVSGGGDDCIVNPSHHTFLDNLKIRQYQFASHPFAGGWEISASTNTSELCPANDASGDITLDTKLLPFNATLASGTTVNGRITADGGFIGTADFGNYSFDFESQFYHAEVARAYSEDENGCPYFVYIHRPEIAY